MRGDTYRRYECLSRNGIKKNYLVSWIVRKCKLCGKFMYRYSKGASCHQCSMLIDDRIDLEIRSYSRKSVRTAMSPIKLSRKGESSLGSRYYR